MFLFSVGISLVFLTSCAEEEPKIQANDIQNVNLSTKVRTQKVSSTAFSSKIELSARLQAFRSAVLAPKSAGRISDVLVRAGDMVQQGDILLEIEPQDYEIGLKEAQAAYQLAYIQAEQAVSNQTRFETLLEEGAVTKVQVEEVQIGAKLSRAQSQRALAGLEIAKSRLDETKLRAPFEGIIVSRNVEVGEMIGGPTQRPPLMLVDISKMRVIAEIPEGEMSNITVGQNITLYISSLGTTHDLRIDRINSALDPVVRTVQFECVLENIDMSLKHGMSGKLLIEGSKGNHIAVPRSAILDRQDNQGYVFVVQGTTVQKKQVTYGSSSDDNVPIYEGLLPNDEIVISGHTRLKDGEIVEIISRSE